MPQHFAASAGQSAAVLQTGFVDDGHCTAAAHIADPAESAQQALPEQSSGPLHPFAMPAHEAPFAVQDSVMGGLVVMQHVCVARSHGALPQQTWESGSDAPAWQTVGGAALSGPSTGSPTG
jgi:hypothetical protein